MHHDRRRFLALLSAAGGALAAPPWLVGCAAPPAQPRLVLLFATCSLDAGYLGAYGGPAGLTPALDRLSASSAVLDNHCTEAGQSGIAYASIFTGCQADRHRVFDHPTPLAPSALTITEAFADAGYDVFFWGGHGMATHDLGYGRGVPPQNHRAQPLTADDKLLHRILDRLENQPAYRALIVTNYTVTHMKYTNNRRFFTPASYAPQALPAHFAALGLDAAALERSRDLLMDGASAFAICGRYRQTVAGWGLSEAEELDFRAAMDYLYRCAVFRLDQLFGELVQLIDTRGLGGESLVAFTADHGETLNRAGTQFKYAHGYQLAPEVLRVPMIVRGPGVVAGHYRFVSRSIDVLPTLAGLAGVKLPASGGPDGVDLAPVLRGTRQAPPLAAFSHTALVHENIVNDPEYADSPLQRLFPARDPALMWVCVRRGSLVIKWTRPDPDGEFVATVFDLEADPYEAHDLFDPANHQHQQALEALKRYKARLVGAWLEGPAAEGLEEAERIRRLEALGYLQGSG